MTAGSTLRCFAEADAEMIKKSLVVLVQQGVWNTDIESMPLASGYLKATIEADQELREEYEVQILNFKGGMIEQKSHGAFSRVRYPTCLVSRQRVGTSGPSMRWRKRIGQ